MSMRTRLKKLETAQGANGGIEVHTIYQWPHECDGQLFNNADDLEQYLNNAYPSIFHCLLKLNKEQPHGQ